MKLLRAEDDASALVASAVGAVAAVAATDGQSVSVINGEKIEANFSALALDKVMPLVESGSLCSQLAAFMSERLDGLGWFVAFNKPELESALANGVEPARLALLAGVKPAAAIKLGLKAGVKVYGCSSLAEMAKIGKAKRQVLCDATASLDIVIVLDPLELPQLDQLSGMLEMAKCQGDRLVGISLQTTEEEVGADAFIKAVALSRLAFEALGDENCRGRVVLDMGHVKDEKKSEEWAALATAQLPAGQLGIQLAARMGDAITRDAVGLCVKVNTTKANEIIINESIYGAFSGLLAGTLHLEAPHTILAEARNSTQRGHNAATFDIFGSSGEDDDVIMSGTVVGGSVPCAGDWLLFPNVAWPHGLENASVHLSAAATPPSPWMTLEEDYSDISELEALFTLPDITEEALENMFNV